MGSATRWADGAYPDCHGSKADHGAMKWLVGMAGRKSQRFPWLASPKRLLMKCRSRRLADGQHYLGRTSAFGTIQMIM